MRIDSEVPLIKLKGLTFNYPERQDSFVFKDTDFEFYRHDRVGLIGPNGSGKTSFFHIIMGLLEPLSGEIIIFGKQREKEKDFQEVRERIGLLFQDPEDQLFSPTVAEDVAFGPLNLGKTKQESIKIVHETLSLLGISGFEDRITYKLSGGEKRLVSLATVISMHPEILLLDEPTTGLDEDTKKRFKTYLKSSNLSYIIVSHDIDFLIETTNIFYKIDNGSIKKLELDNNKKIQKGQAITSNFVTF